jgi:hypothetical protein
MPNDGKDTIDGICLVLLILMICWFLAHASSPSGMWPDY